MASAAEIKTKNKFAKLFLATALLIMLGKVTLNYVAVALMHHINLFLELEIFLFHYIYIITVKSLGLIRRVCFVSICLS